jgi:hypothetical protein
MLKIFALISLPLAIMNGNVASAILAIMVLFHDCKQ